MLVEGILSDAQNSFVTIRSDAKLIEAAKLLTSGTDIVLVCDTEGVLEGIITKTDVVRKISKCDGATCQCPAATVMERNVILCRRTDPLTDVSSSMKSHHLKNIPVVDGDNKPLGVLTARAVLQSLLSDSEYEEAQLIDYIKGIGYR